ncbi:macro domain-containing protein [Bacillus atrophaeus]|uniref:macro domain-containing protein n=1 Tax=Bacillus atrophaeus TaxID=1452 RepID=UPI002E206B18|nr:macro domain-containing protein [Bacillus atrophaeus]
MIYKERQQDLFKVGEGYYLAHCISRDCKMGAGIAVLFENKFKMRERLLAQPRRLPDAILDGKVYNLITKEKYWHKPTLDDVVTVLEVMRDDALERGIRKIAMPRIASGLDRLDWNDVRAKVIEVFDQTEIEIFVCVK